MYRNQILDSPSSGGGRGKNWFIAFFVPLLTELGGLRELTLYKYDAPNDAHLSDYHAVFSTEPAKFMFLGSRRYLRVPAYAFGSLPKRVSSASCRRLQASCPRSPEFLLYTHSVPFTRPVANFPRLQPWLPLVLPRVVVRRFEEARRLNAARRNTSQSPTPLR